MTWHTISQQSSHGNDSHRITLVVLCVGMELDFRGGLGGPKKAVILVLIVVMVLIDYAGHCSEGVRHGL